MNKRRKTFKTFVWISSENSYFGHTRIDGTDVVLKFLFYNKRLKHTCRASEMYNLKFATVLHMFMVFNTVKMTCLIFCSGCTTLLLGVSAWKM